MKVLYLGYSKCGTKTMSAVFRTLGYKCYDFGENSFYLYKEWTKILKHGATKEDFIRMYSDVDAAVDSPVYNLWEQILEAFPDTKLIVMYRDDEAWYKSFKKHSEKMAKDTAFKILTMLSPSCQRLARLARLVGYKFSGIDKDNWPWEIMRTSDLNETLLRLRYRQHNDYIKLHAPKDQLHVVNFADGWKPICKFLEKPVPKDVPFPHKNKADDALKKLMEESPLYHQMKKEMAISVSLIVVLFAIALYWLFIY